MLIGLVGKPSAGKSTFFRAATLAEAEIAHYPFTTIKPNSGIGHVRVQCVDKEFGKQCNPRMGFCTDGIRFVPVQMLDVAGLVPDAHLGKGKGNQFLDDLRQADVLIHVVDISGSVNAYGEPVETGSYDPLNDIRFLELEIDQWYYGILKKGWERFARTVQQEKQEAHHAIGKQLSGLGVNEKMAEDAIKKLKLSDIITAWSEGDLKALATELRKRTKPMIIAANKIDVKGAKENLDRAVNEFPDCKIIPCSSESELALREAARTGLIAYLPGSSHFSIKDESKLSEKQKKALVFIKEKILDAYKKTGVQDVLDYAVFNLLKYIAIFPGGMSKLEDSKGNVLPDCFLMPPKSTALDFAFKLHTDFGKNFIKAMDVKTRMPVGKEHPLKHRDVIEIVTRK